MIAKTIWFMREMSAPEAFCAYDSLLGDSDVTQFVYEIENVRHVERLIRSVILGRTRIEHKHEIHVPHGEQWISMGATSIVLTRVSA